MRPVISESVMKILKPLLHKFKSPDVKLLGQELSKAKIVKDNELKKNVVSLNSIVEFFDNSINKPIRMQIVLPEEADLKKRKVSILAPISIALIGFKESYSFLWQMPSGLKQLKIIKVINE
ncbi:MAG: GreA/GreB family elongation factor [Bacteroidia bacterium]|nr:GreA/GreB family elongation factor [Bacteroidia bacterium]